MGAAARRVLHIAKLAAIGAAAVFCGLVMLVMLIITFSPNQ